MKSHLRRWAFILGFGGAFLVLTAAWAADLGLGRDVLLIAPHDPTTVVLNQALYSPGDPVPDLYGNPMSDPVRVILPDKQRIVIPAENPELVLMRVDKSDGENPLQVQTIWFFTRFALIGLILLGLTGFAFRP